MFRNRPIRKSTLLLLGAALLAGGVLFQTSLPKDRTAAAAAAPEPSAAVPVSGEAVYQQHCLSCHAADGKGSGKFPAIANDHVKKKLGTYDKAYDFISRNMPESAPGSLTEDEYKAVSKYVLSLNGIPTDFSDIQGHWAQKEITDLYDKKYIDGYLDKQTDKLAFKPDQYISRAEFIRYFVKAKELFLSNSTETEFTDIGSSKEDRTYIITAVEYGLINGYPDHTFRPNNTITRAEISAILSRSEMLKAAASSPSFSDIPSDYWAGEAISAVQEAHLFDGYEDGTFRPDQKMTRAEAVAVIYRLLHPAA
ncbi:S-layer homology domain-containing protein [Paenibacillus sp. OAS669]|uniref:S-layer homology domain-containing protein n=1 Tax=Paenibacillus sp. OAS669 TaxID=2663821 RepID=UPI00178BFF7D|nr:S-layer homology domain-containing protein [Paenibacillus sp. OAS669]MBE1447001.1 mono/diheme cytochrome c family protein [Paenibacillus sp. OAS669]